MLLLGAVRLDHRVKERRGRCGRRGRAPREERREEEEQQEAGETRREGGVLRGRRHGGDLSSSCQGGPLGYGCRGEDNNFSASEKLLIFIFRLFYYLFIFFYFHPGFKRKKKEKKDDFKIGFFFSPTLNSGGILIPEAGEKATEGGFEGCEVLLALRLKTTG